MNERQEAITYCRKPALPYAHFMGIHFTFDMSSLLSSFVPGLQPRSNLFASAACKYFSMKKTLLAIEAFPGKIVQGPYSEN
ncbi:hypothetical protein CC2G_014233 [Coprinopsis cinerea AmutBmut pab1-1]|nr:hypothetical protein CC2G_014233 [Coprinopsis cinerea AmutBmut pab1-1]